VIIERARPVYSGSTGKRRGGWDAFFDFPLSHSEGTAIVHMYPVCLLELLPFDVSSATCRQRMYPKPVASRVLSHLAEYFANLTFCIPQETLTRSLARSWERHSFDLSSSPECVIFD
jgi:hypothetical protein